MYTLLTVLIIITCILLILIVLVQNSKGGGLASGFASSNQVMGVRKTTDFLEKLTWGLAIALFVFSLSGTIMLPNTATGPVQRQSEIERQLENVVVPGDNFTMPPPVEQMPDNQPEPQQ
jgi:preprotein translocase subunit SecG